MFALLLLDYRGDFDNEDKDSDSDSEDYNAKNDDNNGIVEEKEFKLWE